MNESSLVPFLAGASLGLTSTAVGTPLDTIKTRMQCFPSAGRQTALHVGADLYSKEGIRGLYRGGLPLFTSGIFMRSAQFGVSDMTKNWLEKHEAPRYRLFGLFDWQVLAAGIAGGFGRGVLEIPADFFKTRRQVEKGYKLSNVLDGAGVTLMRNGILFGAFTMYVDLSKQACQAGYVPSLLTTEDGTGLTPFVRGAVCSNLAWLTCWPADVVKSQRQSGNYDPRVTSWSLLKDNFQTGRMFRGVLPGLTRSFFANGMGMVAYDFVEANASRVFSLEQNSAMLLK